MAQVDDRRDVAPLQVGEDEVGEFPVIFAGAEIGFVQRRAVAQEIDADFLDAVEVLAPPLVMAADLHLVDPGLAVIDGRDAVLDPGREHEVGDDLVSVGGSSGRLSARKWELRERPCTPGADHKQPSGIWLHG